MALSIAQFWKLLLDSRLVSNDHWQQLQLDFARSQSGEVTNDAHAIGTWLVSSGIISAYQATILLNGHSGPFFYGDYRVQDRITSGRFNGYFQAIHRPTGHPVLLQFLTGDRYQDPSYWQSFITKVHQQSKVESPTLQGVHEILNVGDFRLVAYEDLGDGKTAAELIQNGGRMTSEDTCRLTWNIGHALLQLQQSGMVHGHVCPNNIWIANNGHLYLVRDCTWDTTLLDFSKPGTDPRLEAMTPYLAPELSAGQSECTVQSDIYALGCCWYEFLAGQPPFAASNLADRIKQHATEPIQPLETHGVPQQLAQLITYAMAKNPQLRYQDWGDLQQKTALLTGSANQEIPVPTPLPNQAQYLAQVRERQARVSAKAAAEAIKQSTVSPGRAGGFPAINVTESTPTPSHAPNKRGQPSREAQVAASAQTRSHETAWWQSSTIIWVASALGILLLTFIIVANLPDETAPVSQQSTGNSKEPPPDRNGNTSEKGKPSLLQSKPVTPAPGRGKQTIVADPQGDLLWASPTEGTAVGLSWVPPAGQMFMLVRPADLLANQQGELAVTALGPTFAHHRDQWEQESATSLDEVESMILALHDNGESLPRPSFVVRLKESRSRDKLLESWGNPQEKKSDKSSYFKGSKWSFFIPEDGDNRTFVMGAEEEVQEVARNPNSPAPLRRELAALLKTTDQKRHFTILFAPNFLSNNLLRDGRELFFGAPAKLRKPIEWLIGEDVKGGLLSLHVDQHFYMEARLFGGLSQDKISMARTLKERLAEIPQQIEEYFAVLNPPPYWRLIANRYPLMIRQLHRQSRIGVEDGHAVVNIAMQPEAAHNLLLGGELCLSSVPGAAPVVATPGPSGPKNIEELLLKPFSVDIPQQDLEFAIKDIVNDVKETFNNLPFEFNIKIIGPELKLEGITRNQAVRDFVAKDQSLADILTGMVSKANPDPSVKDPSEPAQKLVWVVADDPEKAGTRIILVTTRKDAAEEKYQLPKPFQPK